MSKSSTNTYVVQFSSHQSLALFALFSGVSSSPRTRCRKIVKALPQIPELAQSNSYSRIEWLWDIHYTVKFLMLFYTTTKLTQLSWLNRRQIEQQTSQIFVKVLYYFYKYIPIGYSDNNAFLFLFLSSALEIVVRAGNR